MSNGVLSSSPSSSLSKRKGGGSDGSKNGMMKMMSSSSSSSRRVPLLANTELDNHMEELPREVREELRKVQVGHNLSSVMHNAGNFEQSSWFDSFSAMFERDDYDSSNMPMPSVIAPVSIHDFEPYLTKNQAIVRRFLRNHHIPTHTETHHSAKSKLKKRNSSFGDVLDESSESVRRTQHLAQGLAEAVSQERGADLAAKGLSVDGLKVCFQRVPEKFFQQDYVVSFDEERKNSHAAYLLQEKLSNWLDLVEVCLWSQTTSQAHEFFGALSDLNELNLQVRDACDQIAKLRKHIQNIQKDLVSNHLAVLQKKRKRENLKKLSSLMTKIHNVRETLPAVERLLLSQDYAGAMGLIENARNVVNTELKEVHSLRTLLRHFHDHEEMIVEQLNTKFVELAVSWQEDDEYGNEEGNNEDYTGEKASSFSPSKPGLYHKMLPLVIGLLSSHKNEHVRGVLVQYRTRAIQEVRQCAKNSVSASLGALQTGDYTSDDKTSDVPVKSSQLVGLEPKEFLNFLESVFSSLEMVMVQAHQVHKTFLECLQQIQANDGGGIDSTISEQSEEIVGNVCELSQKSVQKLLALRQDAHEKLHLVDFKTLYDKVGAFSVRAEKLSPNSAIELRGTLRLQAKNLLNATHDKCMTTLKAILDAEEWKMVDVPREIAASAKRIVSGRLSVGGNEQRGTGAMDDDGLITSSPSVKGDGKEKRTKGIRQLVINRRGFRVTSSVLLLVEFFERYLACAQQLALSNAALPQLVQLLRMFNERTNRLVLHQEAKRTAKLDQITSKHLAMASLGLSIVVELIPYLKKILVNCLSKSSRNFTKDQNNINLQLDQVATEYTNHRKKIFEQFTDMIDAVLEKSTTMMDSVDWDKRDPSNMNAEVYMTKLTHSVESLHKSLKKYLPQDQLQVVFQDVINLLNKKLPIAYGKVKPKTAIGQIQARIDLNKLINCLRQMPNVNGVGDELENTLERFSTNTNNTSSKPPTPPKPQTTNETKQQEEENGNGNENGHSTLVEENREQQQRQGDDEDDNEQEEEEEDEVEGEQDEPNEQENNNDEQ